MAGPVPISQKEETKAEDKKYIKAGEGWRDVNAEVGVRWKVNKKKSRFGGWSREWQTPNEIESERRDSDR